MTDEELMKRLRGYWGVWDATRAGGKSLTDAAADRIEALVSALRLVKTDGLHIKHARRAERLGAALRVARVHVANNAEGWSVSRGAARDDLTIVDAALSDVAADVVTFGIGIMQDTKRIAPQDFFAVRDMDGKP
jgi:hypothetical protein